MLNIPILIVFASILQIVFILISSLNFQFLVVCKGNNLAGSNNEHKHLQYQLYKINLHIVTHNEINFLLLVINKPQITLISVRKVKKKSVKNGREIYQSYLIYEINVLVFLVIISPRN